MPAAALDDCKVGLWDKHLAALAPPLPFHTRAQPSPNRLKPPSHTHAVPAAWRSVGQSFAPEGQSAAGASGIGGAAVTEEEEGWVDRLMGMYCCTVQD